MIAWIVLIVLVLAALIVFVNSKDNTKGDNERINNYFGLYDISRTEQKTQEDKNEPNQDS